MVVVVLALLLLLLLLALVLVVVVVVVVVVLVLSWQSGRVPVLALLVALREVPAVLPPK